MSIEELAVLLPCHTLDDFPFHLEDTEADELLATYTALWHPALIARTEKMPHWHPCDGLPDDFGKSLVLLSKRCQDDMPGFWIDQARSEGAVILEADTLGGRDALIEAALDAVGIDTETAGRLPERTADFLALGLCHLLAETLTVQMRYTSLLDTDRFETILVDAAKAWSAGDEETTHEKLTACFDCLAEAKDHFYPVDTYLIDLTLVAASTLGDALAAELAGDVPTNVMIQADELAMLADRHPETRDALCRRIEAGTLSLVGGERTDEHPTGPRSTDEIIGELRAASDEYQAQLGQRPWIYGRRRFGLSPVLPQLLVKTGYKGALHFTLDGGQFPQPSQSKMRWEGTDGSSLDAFARRPLDADQPGTIVNFPQHMSSAMDTDHVAAICFAHWPGKMSRWYRDLKRIDSFAPVLGRFVTLEQFFEETGHGNDGSHFSVDAYRSPTLRRAVVNAAQDPIASQVRAVEQDARQRDEQTVRTLTRMIDTASAGDKADGDNASTLLETFAARLPRSGDVVPGVLIVNPHSFSRRMVVETPHLEHPPATDAIVVAAFGDNDRKEVIVDVPPLGYAWLQGDASRTWNRAGGKPLAEPGLLRNDHFEIRISAHTGAVESLHMRQHRGNLLSQRLALRQPGRSLGDDAYSVMAADEVRVVDVSDARAAILSVGRLLDRDGQLLARYEQTVSLTRLSPTVHFDIELDPVALPEGNPWDSYYAACFAWSHATPDMVRNVGQMAHATTARRCEAGEFLELRGDRTRIAILTGGLPYHVHVGERRLDSLLIVPGEQQRKFRMAIGLNVNDPLQSAMDFATPPMILEETAAAVVPAACWLAYLGSSHVVATHWEPIVEETQTVGVRVRLLNASPTATRVPLRTFRAIRAARKVDFLGGTLEILPPEGERVMIEFTGHEVSEVELRWSHDRHH